MGTPTSLLGQARAFARDYPRDQMPQGYLWDVVDYVPMIVDAVLTGRGAWRWGSDTSTTLDYESGILMPFAGGDQLLAQVTDGSVYQVGQTPPYTATFRGGASNSLQNPVRYKDGAVNFDKNGAVVPDLWRETGVPVPINAAFEKAKVGTVYKDMLVYAGIPGQENIVRFSHPDKDLTAADAYEPNSFLRSSAPVTALAAMRAALLVFHAGSVERIRGTVPPHGTVEDSDMFLEPLFERVGCLDPRTIAFWNDNLIFADEHGVHLTDGAVIRNLANQGGIQFFWRTLYATKISMSGCSFLDYYMITVRRSAGGEITLICDLNRRQWFRFSNLDVKFYIASSGASDMERVWAGINGTHRLARIGPCFFPTFDTSMIVDDNGVSVRPVFETPWYRMGQEGRKRIRFVYLSYDVRTGAPAVAEDQAAEWRASHLQESFESGVQTLIPAPKLATPVLDVGYVRSPQQVSYTSAGQLSASSEYTRFRLPIKKFPYGMAFRVQQIADSTVTRVFDLAVESQGAERSRV